MKLLLILFVGVVIGYMYGYNDHKTYGKSVVERVTERVGGTARSQVGGDFDARMKDVR
jgi:hypothetical protein